MFFSILSSTKYGVLSMNKNITKPKDKIRVLHQPLNYCADPLSLFHTLCTDRPNTLLLESAEINSKQHLKSLMILDAAIRIVCQHHQVTLEALTTNGITLLNRLSQRIDQEFSSLSNQLILTFPTTDPLLDEESRLKQPSSFDALRLIQNSFEAEDDSELNKLAIFIGGLFAYDLVANFEDIGKANPTNQCPDYVFYVAETLLILDHQAQTATLQATLFKATTENENINNELTLTTRLLELQQMSEKLKPLPPAATVDNHHITTNISDLRFKQQVEMLKSSIVKGDIFQIVPSRYFSLSCPSPLQAYQELKQSNPSPYLFYMQDTLFTLFGASPESALKYTRQTNQVEIYPIAGTRPRGKHADGSIDHDLDVRIELELRCNEKENAEHMMLVDLARNDIARISQPGTRYVADLLNVDRYSHVMHLVSRVVGQLRSDLDALHAYQACMNMGTLTGAPKISAMQLIYQIEKNRRGSYGGAVGYLNGHGDLDTCIVIRSAYVENGIAQIQAGAGVVFDSDPQSEADETRNKAQAVINAIKTAHFPTSTLEQVSLTKPNPMTFSGEF